MRKKETKINNEFETLRKKNDDLSKVLLAGECEIWEGVRKGNYSWLKIPKGKKKKLFRLIDIYSNFSNIINDVKYLNKKVDEIKNLKDLPIDDDEE